ncbi:hypothetical protein [Dickeya zeae]|nr:hypothetical protein [Dickeya zeae]
MVFSKDGICAQIVVTGTTNAHAFLAMAINRQKNIGNADQL